MTSAPIDHQLLDTFERSWRTGTAPNLEHFLRSHCVRRSDEIWELVRIDMYHRIRRYSIERGEQDDEFPFSAAAYFRALIDRDLLPRVQDGQAAIPASVLSTEMRSRWLIGDQVGPHTLIRQSEGLASHTVKSLQQEYRSLLQDLPQPSSMRFLRELEVPLNDLQCEVRRTLNIDVDKLIRSSTERLFASSAFELAEQLRRMNLLTPYQAYALTIDRSKPLRIGNYLITSFIKAGGIASVYRGYHECLKRPVAIKIMQPSKEDQHATVQRFHQEVQILAALRHPNIVAAYDGGIAQQQCYLIMEFVDGLDLQGYISTYGIMNPRHAILAIRDAASGLAYAHSRRLVHRDIKPANLMLCNDTQSTRILDLGLAKLMNETSQSITRTGAAVGTVRYMSPEQIRGDRLDGRSDIYALGCTLYYLLVGKHLFTGSQSEIIARHLAGVTSEHIQLVDENFKKIREFLLSMLARDPNHRPASMRHIVRWCDEYLQKPDLHCGDEASPTRQPSRTSIETLTSILCIFGGIATAYFLSLAFIR